MENYGKKINAQKWLLDIMIGHVKIICVKFVFIFFSPKLHATSKREDKIFASILSLKIVC